MKIEEIKKKAEKYIDWITYEWDHKIESIFTRIIKNEKDEKTTREIIEYLRNFIFI